MSNIPQNFYRVCVRGLIKNFEDKILLYKEIDKKWELPGGGLEYGESPVEGLKREINEELGIDEVKSKVSSSPIYFFTSQTKEGMWIANIIYEVEVENLHELKSNENLKIEFFEKDEIENLEKYAYFDKFLKIYTSKK